MITLHHEPPSSGIQYPSAWFDPGDRLGLDGHRHEYLFRTLQCRLCKVTPVSYQYTNLPGQGLPPRPLGRAIQPIYRADKVMGWINMQQRATNRAIFTQEMFDEYHDVVELQGPIDTEGVWLG